MQVYIDQLPNVRLWISKEQEGKRLMNTESNLYIDQYAPGISSMSNLHPISFLIYTRPSCLQSSPVYTLPISPLLTSTIYKAATINPATSAATPNSTLPAAPVASGKPAEPAALPEGLGPPVAAGTVPLPLLPLPLEPVGYRATRVEPEVPVGLWEEPDAVLEAEDETAVAVGYRISICLRNIGVGR
jgi:hypothetical protein